MNVTSSLRALTAAILIVGTGACATSAVVPDSERDTSGQFDGNWLVSVLDTPNTQQAFSNWILNCEDMAWEFPVVIENGQMTTNLDGIVSTANVDGEGNFLLVAPTGSQTSESAGSAASIKRGEVTLFVSGNLTGDQPAGDYRAGVKEFANNGCRTKARFIKS